MRTKTVAIRIKNWFPPEDPIAVLAVKLCILREDYLLELAGMIAGEKFSLVSKPTYGEFKIGLDENSEGWRRAYFFRNSLKTLYELKEEVEEYFGDKHPKLKSSLAKESKQFRDAVKKLRKQLTVAQKAIERIRHNLGAHVSKGEIKKTLRDMPDGTRALFQDSNLAGIRRYKFVSEIVIRMFVPYVPEADQTAKLEELLKETVGLIPVFRTIDQIVGIYLYDRKLTAC